MRGLLPRAGCLCLGSALAAGANAGSEAVAWYRERAAPRADAAEPPFEPQRFEAAAFGPGAFARFARQGVPVIVAGALKGTGMDVEKAPDAWTCSSIAQRFPKARLKKEYVQEARGGEENPIRMNDFQQQLGEMTPSGAKDPDAPQLAPLYWGVKGGDEGEKWWDGGQSLLKEVRQHMQPLPAFLRGSRENLGEILGSPEFWFASPGAGAKAHMDSHCESTLTLQLDGTKRWRLSWPPNVPDGSFARDGTYGDGRPYSIKGGWKPGFSFNLSKGEVLLIPPAFVHESLNVEPEGCSPSLTFQFADPPASSMFRRLWPRMRRTGDFNECWDRVAAFATLAPDGRAKSQLKALGLLPPGQLLDRSPDEILDDAVKAVSKSWANVLRAHDRSGDGRLTDEADNLGGGLGFHDDNIDGEITQEEFARGLADWLNVEIATLREKTSKPKQLQKLEL